MRRSIIIAVLGLAMLAMAAAPALAQYPPVPAQEIVVGVVVEVNVDQTVNVDIGDQIVTVHVGEQKAAVGEAMPIHKDDKTWRPAGKAKAVRSARGLPSTGSDVMTALLAAGVLLSLGSGAVVVARRRSGVNA